MTVATLTLLKKSSGFIPFTIDPFGNPSWDEVIGLTQHVPEVWTHVAITRKNGDLTIYRNGNMDGTGSWSGGFLFNRIGQGLRILGGRRDITHLQGDIDEFRVYNRALSPVEVAALAASP
jgi:class 3 adenylate cyclase